MIFSGGKKYGKSSHSGTWERGRGGVKVRGRVTGRARTAAPALALAHSGRGRSRGRVRLRVRVRVRVGVGVSPWQSARRALNRPVRARVRVRVWVRVGCLCRSVGKSEVRMAARHHQLGVLL